MRSVAGTQWECCDRHVCWGGSMPAPRRRSQLACVWMMWPAAGGVGLGGVQCAYRERGSAFRHGELVVRSLTVSSPLCAHSLSLCCFFLSFSFSLDRLRNRPMQARQTIGLLIEADCSSGHQGHSKPETYHPYIQAHCKREHRHPIICLAWYWKSSPIPSQTNICREHGGTLPPGVWQSPRCVRCRISSIY